MSTTEATTKERVAWCFFDFANSPFSNIALTAFGAPYFKSVLVGEAGLDLGFLGFSEPIGPLRAWGYALSLSMLLVTISSPLMGALADRSGLKKQLWMVYVAVGIGAIAGLGFVPPGAGLAAFGLYVLANFAMEGAFVFYNAFLPELVPVDQVGRLSGRGWALGYVGGLLCLVCSLPLMPEAYTLEFAGSASKIYWVVAAWLAVFSLPAFVFLKDRTPRPAAGDDVSYIGEAWSTVSKLGTTLRAFPVVMTFLAAYFIYNDGITTVIVFTGTFTTDVLEFTPKETQVLFLVLLAVAAPGALLFGRLLDKIGGRKAIMISLVLWIIVVIGTALVTTKAMFWPVGVLAALVIGATQSSSRALMAKLAPRDRVGEFMGLLALSGKASAIVGPFLYGEMAERYGQRVAISAVGIFFFVALIILFRVDEEKGVAQAESSSALGDGAPVEASAADDGEG